MGKCKQNILETISFAKKGKQQRKKIWQTNAHTSAQGMHLKGTKRKAGSKIFMRLCESGLRKKKKKQQKPVGFWKNRF